MFAVMAGLNYLDTKALFRAIELLAIIIRQSLKPDISDPLSVTVETKIRQLITEYD